MPVPRLLVDADLLGGAKLALAPEQAHKLRNVLRIAEGAEVKLFNGRDGEWAGRLEPIGRKGAAVTLERQTRVQTAAGDLHLLFAPLKKDATDFLVEKATELGAAALRPVATRRTNAERVNVERLALLAREAAEQCERLDAPAITPLEPLAELLARWPVREPMRRLVFCDETAARETSWGAGAAPVSPALRALFPLGGGEPGPWAVLVGPEGGFEEGERAILREAAFTVPVGLGPRVLRAETAAIAALALWQAALGDWR